MLIFEQQYVKNFDAITPEMDPKRRKKIKEKIAVLELEAYQPPDEIDKKLFSERFADYTSGILKKNKPKLLKRRKSTDNDEK